MLAKYKTILNNHYFPWQCSNILRIYKMIKNEIIGFRNAFGWIRNYEYNDIVFH